MIEYRQWIKSVFERKDGIIQPDPGMTQNLYTKFNQTQQLMQANEGSITHAIRRSSISSDDISESDESDDQDNLSNKFRDEVSPTNHSRHTQQPPTSNKKFQTQQTPIVSVLPQSKVSSPHTRAQQAMIKQQAKQKLEREQREREQMQRDQRSIISQPSQSNSNELLLDSNTFPPLP